MTEEIVICPACGGRFDALKSDHRHDYCSVSCAGRARNYKRRHGTLEGLPIKITVGSAKWRELNDPRRHLAARDAAYEALGVPVTVVERGDVRVETRGNRVCASSVGIRHQYVTDKGVTYLA